MIPISFSVVTGILLIASMVAVRQVEIQFQLEYNTSIDEFLDSIYAAGADLGDSQIEEWAKSIARSNKMIKLLLSSVDLLRKKS